MLLEAALPPLTLHSLGTKCVPTLRTRLSTASEEVAPSLCVSLRQRFFHCVSSRHQHVLEWGLGFRVDPALVRSGDMMVHVCACLHGLRVLSCLDGTHA